MAVNRVDFGGDTLIDLTGDTLESAEQLLKGIIAHAKDGSVITGQMEAGGGGGSSSQTGVVDASASYMIIHTYLPDSVSVTVPTRVVTATSAAGELQA